MADFARFTPQQLNKQLNSNRMQQTDGSSSRATEGGNTEVLNPSLLGNTKKKNRKKKKNKSTDHSPLQETSEEEGNVEHGPLVGGGSKGKPSLDNDKQLEAAVSWGSEGGWQVAGSRRSRRGDENQKSWSGTRDYAAGANSMGRVASSSHHPTNVGGAPSQGPQRRLEGPGGQEKTTGKEKRESSSNDKQKGRLNRNGLNCTGSPIKEAQGNGHSVNFTDGSMEFSGISDRIPTPNAWRSQANPTIPQANGSQNNLVINDGNHLPAFRTNAWNRPQEPPRMASLLPSEKTARPMDPINSRGRPVPELSPSFPPADFPGSLDNTDDEGFDDDDDDESDWDDSDSGASVVSHETARKDKQLRQFFDTLSGLTVQQLNEYDREWHCPACQGGVGAIDWYKGLQALLAHANTKRSKRVKLHRKFACILEEEMRRLGTLAGENESMFGKWKGLRQDNEIVNPLIVWPPAVIIQNTRLELDDQEKWTGMGNKELLDYFKDYNVLKAKAAYGPQGHRGMSILVFPETPTGYMDAQRLDKCFKDEMRGRANWDKPGKVISHPGGKRILYGYMASNEDMDIFNKHAGKSKLKWNLKRLSEVVVVPMRQMHEDNEQLNHLKVKVEQQKEESKTLAKTVSLITNTLRLREEEIKIIRHQALKQHNQNQEEMDELEKAYKNKINQLMKRRAKQEEELQQQEEHFKEQQIEQVEQLEEKQARIPKDKEQSRHKLAEEIAQKSELIETSINDCKDYESQKRDLMAKHHMKRVEFMRNQLEQLLAFEKELEEEKAQLQELYLSRMRGS